jgi:hypothetical protein
MQEEIGEAYAKPLSGSCGGLEEVESLPVEERELGYRKRGLYISEADECINDCIYYSVLLGRRSYTIAVKCYFLYLKMRRYWS